jgi:hypothetical protein
MAVTSAFTNQAKQDFLNGVHQSGDVYKCALYTQAAATLNKDTTAYTTTGEIANGNGYTTGGATLAGFSVSITGDTAHLSFTDPQWTTATITADAALIYNSSKSNKALCSLAFTSASSTNGTWTLDLPAAGASALMRIA